MYCKKLRSEYMKRFKEPQWDAYGKCYAELLSYRLRRRLLEQAHKPWLWEGWEGSSDSSSDQSVPQKPEPSTAPVAPKPNEPAAPKEPPSSEVREQASSDIVARVLQQHRDAKEELNMQPTDTEAQTGSLGNQRDGKDCHKEDEEKTEVKGKCTRRKINKSPPRPDLSKENQQPFVLYGCGEKKKDTGSQKTHNVFAPTNQHEIHESALRAKNRRQKEKRRQLLQRQRARSADARTNLIPDPDPLDNPWMTEYMRCYSARTR
uniref:Centriole, cilia and spindle associated protein n=1 Tax=Leptobrachium leishanense TaxID=445787 RepID=A0A8C5MPD2_9ANUR